MLEQLLSPGPGKPDPTSSTQESREERGLSTVPVELSWSHWPHRHVIVEASEGYPGSHHLNCRWGRSRPYPHAKHLAAPPL